MRLFSIAVGGSLTTYLFEGDYTLLDNILNSADLLLCTYVAVVIFIWGDATTKFTRFDIFADGADGADGAGTDEGPAFPLIPVP